MANRFIGGALGKKSQSNSSFASRASTGTYFDNTGVLRTAPVNQPRLNYTYVNGAWTSPSVLIEPESTNIQLYSRQVGTGNWGGEYGTVGANATTAPDGTTTATQVTPTAVNNFHRMTFGQNFNSTNGVYTTSLFLKANGYTYVTLRFDDGSGTIIGTAFNLTGNGSYSTGYYDNNGVCSAPLSSSIISVGNGWYRVSVTVRVINYNNVGLYYYVMSTATTSYFTGDGSSGIFAWGGQVERGYTMTSFIPTTTSFVTRSADLTSSTQSGIYNLKQIQENSALDSKYTIVSFTSTGPSNWIAPRDVTEVEVLVVGGGGGGGSDVSGGGGGGGVVYYSSYPVTPGKAYFINVGSGGVGQPFTATTYATVNGGNSQFGDLIAYGGGGGGSWVSAFNAGSSGGSGGGGYPGSRAGQAIAGQGFPGGLTTSIQGGGGGGAGGPGSSEIVTNPGATQRAPGLKYNITGTLIEYGYGGRGGSDNFTGGIDGIANTGGGGDGTGGLGMNGGSGIVVIKYKTSTKELAKIENTATVVQKFTISNTWTCPAGVTSVEALVVAGGGGGGTGDNGQGGGGGGGAGGLVYSSSVPVTPGSTYSVAVGSGGYASTSGVNSGFGGTTELVTNGDFSSGTSGWTATAATISSPYSGIFQIIPDASVNGFASRSITTVTGTQYAVLFTVVSNPTNFARLYVGTTQNGSDLANIQTIAVSTTEYTRTYGFTFTATGSTTWISMVVGGGTQQITRFSKISVTPAILNAIGGGAGGLPNGTSGGSGGGGGRAGSGGSATQNSAGTSGYGNAGGSGNTNAITTAGGAGGGGAGSAGFSNPAALVNGQPGGAGIPFSVAGEPEYYAGGGGGGAHGTGAVGGSGGIGGGGSGSPGGVVGKSGAPYTGGGGGGGGGGSGVSQAGAPGGSGIVILRYKVPNVAVFKDNGTWTCPAGVTNVQALVVAGGGAGGIGGGGAGGLVYSSSVPVTPGITYPIIVGQGGIGTSFSSGITSGNNSSFATIVAFGGGAGGYLDSANASGYTGGSGGGAATNNAGNTLGTPGAGTYGQGNTGGSGTLTNGYGKGGGGGAGSAAPNVASGTTGGAGGSGLQFSISGIATYYAGGAGGGSSNGAGNIGGTGTHGGGNGASGASAIGDSGTANTGGGGGGSTSTSAGVGSNGGSGIVIVRWQGA